jgi:hypothetical protein
MAIAKDRMMRNLKGLKEFIWLEECSRTDGDEYAPSYTKC